MGYAGRVVLMAISQRLRAEIIKRDNGTCQMCGAKAPEVKIAIDHVQPKALGGTDEVTNLRVLCVPCNSGKSSISPDAPAVAAVEESARMHADLMRGAYAVLVERIGKAREYQDEFLAAYDYEPTAGWEDGLNRWHRMGVPVEIIIDAAETATRKTGFINRLERFKYFCGIVWNQVAAVDAVTADKAILDGSFYSPEEIEELELEAWKLGWDVGYQRHAKETATDEARIYTQNEVDDIRQTSYNEGYSCSYQDTWNQVHDRYPQLAEGGY